MRVLDSACASGPAAAAVPADEAEPIPTLSVVMPVHNALPFLDQSVRSILDQHFSDFEFVIGDDASTDGSRESLRAWARRDSRIRLFEGERQRGPAGSSNWVVGHARASLIARMDADDVAHPDRLRRQIEVMRAHSDAVLVGALGDSIDCEGRRIRPVDRWRITRKSCFAPFSHSSILIRREAFDRIGGYREECAFWEDLDLYLRLSRVGRLVVISEDLGSYRHAPTSTRLVSDARRVERAVDRMYRCLEAYGNDGDYDRLLDDSAPSGGGAKLLPQTFIAFGSQRLWTGERPAILGGMWRRGALSWNLGSIQSLVWATWGALSPRSLRFVLTALVHGRNLAAGRRIRDGEVYDWVPGPAGPPAPPPA